MPVEAPAETGTPNKERSALPDAPVAKSSGTKYPEDAAVVPPVEGSAIAIQPFANSGVKPAGRTAMETPRERGAWYGLIAVSHSAAGFDAYSTRRAVSGNYGVEGDPMLRPFSHSNALYAATQVSPAVMDYLGHRMMTSHSSLLRRFWWLPQTAGASFSLAAGVHNYRLVP